MPKTTRYPVYIISKGRWEQRQTSRALDSMSIDYRIVVEPQEHENYAAVIPPAKILTLPFSNLGQGSIPARNWVWEHALATGAERHWIIDDNIRAFYRYNWNQLIPCVSPAIFRAAEDFVDRYENVAEAGFQYYMFVPRKSKMPAFYLNTRIYSCILLRNDLPHRWRGRYNEDTDLSLRILKNGWCTVLFNAFVADKVTTMTMKGGNTDELYQGDGRRKMAESLVEQHPDVTTVTWKWGRWQHQVDYSGFKRNKLQRKAGVLVASGVNEYGMTLQENVDGVWLTREVEEKTSPVEVLAGAPDEPPLRPGQRQALAEWQARAQHVEASRSRPGFECPDCGRLIESDEHDRFILDDGLVFEHPDGTFCVIARDDPRCDQFIEMALAART